MNTQNTNRDPLDFSDLEGDLNEGARPNRAPKVGGVEWSNPCPKCRGSGNFVSYAGRIVGPCHMCKGKGTLTFKSSPEHREKARTQRIDRKEQTRVENGKAWEAAHRTEWEWLLKSAAKGFDFATSMLDAIFKFGDLTDNQMAAVQRLIARDAERLEAQSARTANAREIDVSRIAEMFAKVRATNPIKQPTLLVESIELQLAKEHSTNPGFVYVRRVTDDTYLGKISPDGVYSPSFKATDADLETIKATAADPLGLATAYGLRTGRCSCCGLKLTNKLSVQLGIGPICRDKWGM